MNEPINSDLLGPMGTAGSLSIRNSKFRAWLDVTGFFAISYIVLGLVYSKISIANPYAERIIQALVLILFFLVSIRFIFRIEPWVNPLAPKKLGHPEILNSLRFSVPMLALLIPAIFFQVGPSIFSADWKIYLIESTLHSSMTEELMYRAIIFVILLRRFSVQKAALYSALIFGASHLNRVFTSQDQAHLIFNLSRVVVSTFSGYCLALLYWRYNFNLWVPIIFHFVLNAIGMFTAQDSEMGILINLTGNLISFAWIIYAIRPGRYEVKPLSYQYVPATEPS